MGHQGKVHRRSELERVARRFNAVWWEIAVWCWRDDDAYWITFKDGTRIRVHRKTLDFYPLTNASDRWSH